MTRFRPCIDLHSGQVKQIVGGTLSNAPADLKTNYVSALPASHYAGLYRTHDLRGGHVVKLGPGNDDAAREALSTWPGGLQVAGGITDENARYWIDQGADKVYIYMHICIYLFCSLLEIERSENNKCGRLLSLRSSSPEASSRSPVWKPSLQPWEATDQSWSWI